MAALFVPLSSVMMPAPSQASSPPRKGGWTIQRVEELLQSLTGVISARVVARPGGEIQEVHLLTPEEVHPKQTVRNVESALMAHFHLAIDHRKISVAQTKETLVAAPLEPESEPPDSPAQPAQESRILFVGHQLEMERGHRLRFTVSVEWKGQRHVGEAIGADLPRVRMETVASATLKGIEAAVAAGSRAGAPEFALALDGTKLVEAFERQYVLVAVHAISGRTVTLLAGAAAVGDQPDRAVILATLQATDRWVRGRT